MKLVGAGLCDCVNHTACGTAVLGRIIRSVDLVFADCRLADYVSNSRSAALFREECLVVIAAVDRAVIKQTGNAAKTNETESAVGNCPRRKNREVRPATTVG